MIEKEKDKKIEELENKLKAMNNLSVSYHNCYDDIVVAGEDIQKDDYVFIKNNKLFTLESKGDKNDEM